jgi:hypothetical protein
VLLCCIEHWQSCNVKTEYTYKDALLLFAIQVNVIDLQAFLTSGQEKRLSAVRTQISRCESVIAVQYLYLLLTTLPHLLLQLLLQVIEKLEKDTGFRVRILTQRYPQTPGLAIKVHPLHLVQYSFLTSTRLLFKLHEHIATA